MNKIFLLTIFFLSGFVSLVYQVIWQRLLTLYYGIGQISITIIVTIFMAGLGFGALCSGRYISQQKFKAYFYVELLIALFGLISFPFLNFIGKSTAGISYIYSFMLIFMFLAIPTFLMGTTLPILVGIFTDYNPDFFNNVSLLYFINTLGASFGALVTGYVFLSFGFLTTTYIAVTINIILAGGIYFIKNEQ